MTALYSTSDAVRNLLTPHVPFQTAEQKFLLEVLRSEAKELPSHLSVDWNRLKDSFAVGFLYRLARERNNSFNCPEEFLNFAKQVMRRTMMRNQYRQQVIKRLATAFAQKKIDVVFVKGAAEIIRFDRDSWHLRLRDMDDIDAVCPTHQLDEAEHLMQQLGYELYDYGKPMSNEQLRHWSITHTGHYLFNPTMPEPVRTAVELHTHVATGRTKQTYPADFSEELIRRSIVVDFDDVPIRIPNLEHMLIYLVCHAACPKDHSVMFSKENFYFDELTDETKDQLALVNARWDWYQIWFLLRLRLFLDSAATENLHWETVIHAFASVQSRSLLDIYLGLAALILGQSFPWEVQQSTDELAKRRAAILLNSSIWDHDAVKSARYKLYQARELIKRRAVTSGKIIQSNAKSTTS